MVVAFPEQSGTDFGDPEQRFVWALRGLEFNGFPLVVPEQVARAWSRHLSECGFVHVSELEGLVDEDDLPNRQTVHFQPPVRGQDHAMNASGQWIPVEDAVEPPVTSAVGLMTPAEKAEVIASLREEGLID